jgi:hypothetical protein
MKKWLMNWLSKVGSPLCNHKNTKIIERYAGTYLVKNFNKDDNLEKLTLVKPYKIEKYRAKCVCRDCGCVFIANFIEKV